MSEPILASEDDVVADAALDAAERVTRDYVDRRSDEPPTEENIARAVLTAVAPLIEARVRAAIADQIELAIPKDGAKRAAHYLSATRRAARIARGVPETSV